MIQDLLQNLLKKALLKASMDAVLRFLQYLEELIPVLEQKVKEYYSKNYPELQEKQDD